MLQLGQTLNRWLPQTTCVLLLDVQALPPSPPAEKARQCLASGSGLAPPPTDAQVIAGTILGIAGMAIDASIHRRHW
jgi:hypothetical protein